MSAGSAPPAYAEPTLPRSGHKLESFRFRRLWPAALALGAGALILVSHSLPWWSFKLYAPQYPQGLGLEVLLSGVRGDVREVDMLNHYIGMASLSLAAPLERRYSALAVVLISTLTVGLLLGGRRARFAGVALAAGFPLGFIADSFYWLYRFGHELDPRAPIELQPFTPEMFGNGQIGQFLTFARPELGFWCAFAALALTLPVALRQTLARSGTVGD